MTTEVSQSNKVSSDLVRNLDGLSLYTLTYKRGSQAVQHTLVAAEDLKRAQKYGRQWCDDQINCRYIWVEDAIPIGPWTMEGEPVEQPEVIPTKPPAPVPVAPAAAVNEKRK